MLQAESVELPQQQLVGAQRDVVEQLHALGGVAQLPHPQRGAPPRGEARNNKAAGAEGVEGLMVEGAQARQHANRPMQGLRQKPESHNLRETESLLSETFARQAAASQSFIIKEQSCPLPAPLDGMRSSPLHMSRTRTAAMMPEVTRWKMNGM